MDDGSEATTGHRIDTGLREVLEASPIGIGVVDQKSGKRLFVNNALAEMHGVGSKDELYNEDISQTWVDQSRLAEAFAKARRNEALVNFEAERIRKDGSRWWVLMNSQPIIFDGVEAGAVWHIDITERKRAEEQIQRSQLQLNSILEASPAGIAVTLRDSGETVYANARFAEQLGLGEDRNIGADLKASWVDPRDRERVIGQAKNTGVVEDFEVRRRRRDSSEFWAQMSALLIDYEGQQALLSWTYDITERRKAEQKIHEARLLQEAFDTFSDMVILYDRDERVIFTNNRYHEIYPNAPSKTEIGNYSMEGLLRRSLEAGQIDQPLALSDPEAWLQQSLAARRDRNGGSGETTHKSGRTYFYRYGWTSEGGMILVQFDITERKRTEEALKNSEKAQRRILEDSPIAVAISVDDQSEDDGIIQFANARFTEMLGVDASEITAGAARTNQFFSNGDDRQEHEELLDDGVTLKDMELEVRRRDGSKLWVLMSISPILYNDRKSAMIWIYDISELKRTAAMIAEKEAQLRLALENMPGAILVVDRNLDVVLINETYKDFYGDPDGLVRVGASVRDIIRSEVERGLVSGDGSPEKTLEDRISSFRITEPQVFEDRTPDGRHLQLTR